MHRTWVIQYHLLFCINRNAVFLAHSISRKRGSRKLAYKKAVFANGLTFVAICLTLVKFHSRRLKRVLEMVAYSASCRMNQIDCQLDNLLSYWRIYRPIGMQYYWAATSSGDKNTTRLLSELYDTNGAVTALPWSVNQIGLTCIAQTISA